jgi:hypothetical protein
MLVSLFRRVVVSAEVHISNFLSHGNIWSHLCFFWPFGSLPWIKETKQSPTHFLVVKHRDKQVCVCWKVDSIKCTSWEWSWRKTWKYQFILVTVFSVSSFSMGWNLSSLLSQPRFLLVFFLLRSLVLLLISPQTYPWPLRTSCALVPFRAFVSAAIHPLTWLIPPFLSGFNLAVPSSGDLTWLLHGGERDFSLALL